ncbi:hypothetical protein VTI74DRAFT_1165 [Chaetomium olivicolor]
MEMICRRPYPATLSDLPNEILTVILGYFCLHCRDPNETAHAFFPDAGQDRMKQSWCTLDCQVLYSMCLVSSRFTDVAQAVLYHQFSPGYGDSQYSAVHSWERRLLPFLRTVTLRPDLAVHVRRVMLCFKIFDELQDNDGQDVETVFETAARTRGFSLLNFLSPFRKLWAEIWDRGYRPGVDETICLLLACLPNLASFSFPTGRLAKGIPFPALLAAGTSSLSIQTVDIWLGGKEAGSRLAALLNLIPSGIRTLNLSRCDDSALRGLCPTASVRNVCIVGDLLTGPSFAQVLSLCGPLESVVFEAGRSETFDERNACRS